MPADVPKILFHRPTPWVSEVTCSTKILASLMDKKGFEVIYMQDPLDPAHYIRGEYPKIWKETPKRDGRIQILAPFSPISTRDVWPLNTQAAISLRYQLAFPSLRQTALKKGDVLWTTVPGSATPFKKIFPDAQIIFHVIDYYPAFRGERVKSIERQDYAISDQIVTIGDCLADYVRDELGVPNEKVKVLGQGVNLSAYRSDQLVPSELKSLPGPIAIWVGVLDKGDPDLFESAAMTMSKLGGSMVLIGPRATWADELEKRFENTHCLGARKAQDVPAYLKSADIGLMLYSQERIDVYFGQNPLKLYEYAAAGLKILSTPHAEYKHLKPPLYLVETSEDVKSSIHDAAREDSVVTKDSVSAFAERHDWAEKARFIERTFL